MVCERKPRSWFLAESKGPGRMLHVISARNHGMAHLSMGRLSEEYNFSALTWSDMVKIIGVAPPCVEQETTLAEGPLLFEYNGRVVSIEVAG